MLLRICAATAVSAAVLVPAAPAQAPSVLGRWAGTASITPPQRVVYEITALTVGQPAGTTRYRRGGGECRDRLTFVGRSRGGFSFRATKVAGGRKCTTGDRLFLRRDGSRLRVRLRPRAGGTFRFTLKRL